MAPFKMFCVRAQLIVFFFLLIGSGIVLADGLPGEYLVTQRWRELFGANSPVANPAYVGDHDYLAVRGAFTPSQQGAYKLWEIGVIAPVGLSHSLGVTWMGQDDGAVQTSSFDASGRIVLADNTVSNTANFFMLSYAYNLINNLNIGCNLTYAYQTNFGESLKGAGLDLGIAYRLFDRPEDIGRHLLGITTQNLIAPSMSTDYMPSLSNKGQYARNIKCSWNGRFLSEQLEGGIDLDIKDFMAAKDEFSNITVSGNSVEIPAAIEWDLSVRVGVWLMKALNLYVQMGFDKNAIDYWGLAGGMNVPLLNNGRDLQMLYQYNQKADNPAASTHTIYLRVNVGKHRQEMFSKTVVFSPNDLFNKARDLYYKENYWDALFVFGQIEKLFPGFFKADWVAYYIGSCFEKLDMRNMAIWRLNRAKTRFAESPVQQYADLDLMRIYYHNNDLSSVIRHFSLFTSEVTTDSLKYHGCYIMGQAYLKKGNFIPAIQLLGAIPSTHPEFLFAQHSAAVAYYCNNDEGNAEKFLTAIVNVENDPKSPAEKEIYARSCLFLGYLYYEQNHLAKAVTTLRLIPASSRYFQDALLGLGWSAIKARQWTDCITIGQQLQQSAGALTILKGEGVIIQGSGLMGLRRFDEAVNVLKPVSDEIKVLLQPPADSLAQRRDVYTQHRAQYESLADATNDHAYDLAGYAQATDPGAGKITTRSALDSVRQINNAVAGVLDSLERVQIATKRSLDEYTAYVDNFTRRLFLSRNLETVRNDIEYLFAVVQRFNLNKKVDTKEVQSREQQKTIDVEIEKLKKQVEDGSKK